MAKYQCEICGYVYDEQEIGLPFADLPDDWVCPLCGVPKSQFKAIDSAHKLQFKPMV